MIKKILIWMLPLVALIGGTAAGSLLAPEKHAETAEAADDTEAVGEGHESAKEAAKGGPAAWFSFPNQFFVPIVRRGDVDRIMVLTLTIETSEHAKADIEAQEHRLRDALLRSLIIHANTGGFSGNYTAEPKLQKLRGDLLAAATGVAGPDVHNVLIEDLALTDG